MHKLFASAMTLWLFLFSSVAAFGEHVVLKNGDRISGKIVFQNEEAVVLETEYAGEIKIVTSQVAKIVTEAEPLKSDLNVENAISLNTTLTARTEPAKAVASPARLFGGRFMGIADGWSGNANAGFSYTSGNSTSTTLTTGIRAVKSGGHDNLTVYFRSLWVNNNKLVANSTTSNAFWGGVRYDRNMNKKVFAFGSFDFERDRPKNLHFRSVVGTGFGHHTVKTDRTELDVFTGGAWNHTWQLGSNSDSPEALAGNSLKHKLTERLKVQQNFTFYQNITDKAEYRYLLETTLSVDLTKKIGWFVTVGDRYNNDPIGTAERNDFLFTTGVKWNYGRKK